MTKVKSDDATLDERATAEGGQKLTPGQISVAFEKLFGGGRGVSRFARSGLRYVNLGRDTILVEQNPAKRSEWAQLAKEGRRVAWLMREGEYLARIVDGETTWLGGK